MPAPSSLPLCLFAFASVVALHSGCGGGGASAARPAAAGATGGASVGGGAAANDHDTPPTVEEAVAFAGDVDAHLRKLWLAGSRASWVNATYITDDTQALSASAREASMEYLSLVIPKAKRFLPLMEAGKLPPAVARQIHLLRFASTLPAPSDPRERAELASIVVSMQSEYGAGKYCPPNRLGKCQTLEDLSRVMAHSRKWDELLEAWTGWHSIAPPMRKEYERYVELGNKGAREIGFRDLGDLWRSGYDMSAADFEQETDRLWQQVKPLYEQLHCYARSRLRAQYGKDRVSDHAPLPAHILGNMWAQDWIDIYPMLEPFKGQPSLDVTAALKAKKYDEKGMVRLGEQFFTSLGFAPLPDTFWKRSLIKKPADRDVVCHASAWDIGNTGDLRIKMCVEINEVNLVTIHHELGHVFYYQQYHPLPILLQSGANDGFHEGIGDTLALSVTPGYLKQLGLLESVPANGDPKGEINFLMKKALEKVAFLPFGKLIDQWRWDVFAGKTPPSRYNEAWWTLRRKYQGMEAPVPRTEADFDPGAKFHVPANTPYTRYFLAAIYQFQFHRALCRAAGHKGSLTTCSIHGSREAGEKLRAMLAMGASQPWPKALEAISGETRETRADATAILEYFAPLSGWLAEHTKGERCGW